MSVSTNLSAVLPSILSRLERNSRLVKLGFVTPDTTKYPAISLIDLRTYSCSTDIGVMLRAGSLKDTSRRYYEIQADVTVRYKQTLL